MKMDKNKSNKGQHNTETMLKEKTNQDYNKQKPNPTDPNQRKNNLEDVQEESGRIHNGKLNHHRDAKQSKN
jgi:hypothetical protein